MITANHYRNAVDAGGGRLREDPPAWWEKPDSEIELQARWYAGDHGQRWICEDGRVAEVIDFGHWNREPGPDFTGARVRFDGGPPCPGDIEIDTDVRDWERHGHGGNPDFNRTILHIFLQKPGTRFFTRTSEHREVAQIFLTTKRSGDGAVTSPGARWMLTDAPERARAIVLQAARYRLERKGSALRRSAAVHGSDEAWFQAMAVALGYKRNKIPFLLLAQRCPRTVAASARGEALLFGTAGFLEMPLETMPDAAARRYVRELWDRWWDVRSECERLILAPELWTLGATRPSNHPHRRIAALAALARNWQAVRTAIAAADRKALIKTLSGLEHVFWSSRFTLKAAPLARAHALVGPQRTTDILLNIFYPQVLPESNGAWAQYIMERGPKVERTIRTLGERYFGAAADQKFLNLAAHQQGLLQIAQDFADAADPENFVDGLRTAAELDGTPDRS